MRLKTNSIITALLQISETATAIKRCGSCGKEAWLTQLVRAMSSVVGMQCIWNYVIKMPQTDICWCGDVLEIIISVKHSPSLCCYSRKTFLMTLVHFSTVMSKNCFHGFVIVLTLLPVFSAFSFDICVFASCKNIRFSISFPLVSNYNLLFVFFCRCGTWGRISWSTTCKATATQ